ncbi:Uncharacterised protein [Salmonella enterica subsp. salamae]|uniref:Uncharacterized protein n=1 Tax=Salmonella enterica TaxID=28901 RepID=A0A379QTP0_SALER|nr:hypothetical protein [Salmonella enterica subsp. salamae]EDV1416366.1 hypothetical protein [Salmonella enterica subsp. salamae]SUF67483.1 Uncharacterised protein [Salmonella enterica]SUI17779.1 Uncharacterised protein [Salmonella enterica subsp. salamae]
MRAINFKYKTNKNGITTPFYNSLIRTLTFIFSHLPQISVVFAVIGFINIWIYLYRIEQLNLLTSFLSSPSTLLAIFASLSLIVTLWGLMLLLPTILFSSLLTTMPKSNSKSIILHAIVISIILSILGTTEESIANGLLTYIVTFYICYFLWLYIQNKNIKSLGAFFIGLFLNIPTLIIIILIYNKAALANIERAAKVIILLIYLIMIYMPLIISNDILTKKEKTRKNNLLKIFITISLVIVYFTATITPGLIIKLNNYAISFAGLRSDDKFWYKINTENFPSGWLEYNWGVSSINQKEVWIQGYPIIQNNNITFVCSEKTHSLMDKYISARLNLFVQKKNGSMDTKSCILIEKNTDSSVKVTESATAPIN